MHQLDLTLVLLPGSCVGGCLPFPALHLVCGMTGRSSGSKSLRVLFSSLFLCTHSLPRFPNPVCVCVLVPITNSLSLPLTSSPTQSRGYRKEGSRSSGRTEKCDVRSVSRRRTAPAVLVLLPLFFALCILVFTCGRAGSLSRGAHCTDVRAQASTPHVHAHFYVGS